MRPTQDTVGNALAQGSGAHESGTNLPGTTGMTPDDCTTCGACCFSQAPDYLRVFGTDHERLGDQAERLTHFIGNRVYMRLEAGHCAALTIDADSGRFLCSIYERRPDVCRWLERGSGYCVAERSEKVGRAEVRLVELRRAPARS